MTGIISIVTFIIVILFLAGIFFGEDSLLILAEKMFFGLFLVVVGIWLIICVPWLLVAGLIVLVIVYTIGNNNKQNENYGEVNNIRNNNNENLLSLTDSQEPSDFQKELQQNTKTPQQVEDENWLKEKEQITYEANRDYKYIKQQLLDKAKSGQYSVANGYKAIYIDFYCSYLMKFYIGSIFIIQRVN